MRFYHLPVKFSFLSVLSSHASSQATNASSDPSWHAPFSSNVNNLASAVNGTGVYGFIFNSSTLPDGVPYGTYNWCNMPHVRASEYPRVNSTYKLRYVELMHRHHKRTPYASNTFPHESYPWYCNDEGLFYSGAPLPPSGANHSASTYWSVYTSSSNPLAPAGFNGTCQFPQITRGGLDDSEQHGRDLFDVYHGLLDFIPASYDPKVVSFRVTNNVITSQVASMVIGGMYPHLTSDIPLSIQPVSIDSLEPAYSCPAATYLTSSYATGATTGPWQQHLTASAQLFASLDSISGIDPTSSAWHASFDHYFDNLSARLCHSKPLPCNIANSTHCVSAAQADEVFRLGQWEYSYTYRDSPLSLRASTSAYGIFIAELAQNFRDIIAGGAAAADKGRYRHNVAHDGSVSRLLSLLQIENMVWPGMGAEVVFELYERVHDESSRAGGWFLRVLWGGQVLRSSDPVLGVMDMVPIEAVLGYFDGLVGVGAEKVPGLCGV